MKQYLKIGSVVSLVGLIAYLFIRIEGYKDSKADQQRELHRLNWLLEAKEAENDSIKGLGRYVIADTLWDSIPVPYPVHDTLPPDTHYVRIPRFRGSITIDTSKTFGQDYNPLSIKVTGKFFFPEQEPDTNWLKIVPRFRDAPYLPATRSQKTVGFGVELSEIV